ncbi:MFS transporter [Paenibacillus elgii]
MSLVAFWFRIHRVDQPFLQSSLLRNRPYMNLTVMGFVAYVLHFATLFLMPLVIIRLYGQSSAVTGFLIFPGAILTALLSPRIGRWIDRLGNTPVILAGHATLPAATFVFALLSTQYLYAITAAYMLMSVSVSAIGSSVSNEMSHILAKHEIGGGMGMAQLTQFFGGALGVALAGASLVWQASAPLQAAYRNIFWVMPRSPPFPCLSPSATSAQPAERLRCPLSKKPRTPNEAISHRKCLFRARISLA